MPLASLTGLTQQEKEKFCAAIYAALLSQYNAKSLGMGNKTLETRSFKPNQTLIKQALEHTYGGYGENAAKYRAIINNQSAWLDIMNGMVTVLRDYNYNSNELDSNRAYKALLNKEQHKRFI